MRGLLFSLALSVVFALPSPPAQAHSGLDTWYFDGSSDLSSEYFVLWGGMYWLRLAAGGDCFVTAVMHQEVGGQALSFSPLNPTMTELPPGLYHFSVIEENFSGSGPEATHCSWRASVTRQWPPVSPTPVSGDPSWRLPDFVTSDLDTWCDAVGGISGSLARERLGEKWWLMTSWGISLLTELCPTIVRSGVDD